MDRVKEEIMKFGEILSVRGVSKIIKTKRKPLRIMWSCAVVGCTGVLVWQLVTLFVNYSSYPYRTAYGEISTPNIFPSITVCNLHPKITQIDNDIYFTEEEYKKIMINITTAMNEMFINTTKYINIEWHIYETYFRSIPKYKTNTNDSIPFLVDHSMIRNDDQHIIYEDCIQRKHENVNQPDFNGCHLYQISKFCEISGNSVTMILYTNTSYIHQDYFKFARLDTDGVKIQLSAPGDIDDIAKGFNLGPGTDSFVQISMKVKTILDKPYNSEGCESKKYIDESSDTLYGTYVCKIKCIQDKTLEKCQCVSGLIFVPPMYNNENICGNNTLASKKNNLDMEAKVNMTRKAIKQLQCEDDAYMESHDICRSNCKNPCIETYYERTVQTLNDWPKISSQLEFFEDYINSSEGSIDDEIYTYFKDYYKIIENYYDDNIIIEQLIEFFRKNDKIRSNFLQVTFSFTSDYPISIIDTPVYTWESLLGNVGGSLSFWMGITIMTFVELIEFLCNLIRVMKDFIFLSKRSSVGRFPVSRRSSVRRLRVSRSSVRRLPVSRRLSV